MEEKEYEPSWKDLRFQIFAALCAAFNYMPAGIGFAFSTILLPPGLLTDEKHVFRNHTSYTVYNTDNLTLPDVEVHFANHIEYRGQHDPSKYLQVNVTQASWIASLLSLFSILGAALSGLLMDRLGRKMSLQITAALHLCGWALTVASAYCLPLVYLARILNGLAEGLICSTCYVYVAEVSHPRIRASCLAFIAGSIAVGISVTSLLGYLLYWPGVAAFATALTFVTLVALYPLPETPHWILRHVKDPEEREKRLCDSLKWIYRNPKIYEHQLSQMRKLNLEGQKDTNEEPHAPVRIKKILALLLIIMFMQVQSGAYIVIFFAFQLFEAAGSTGNTSWLLMNLVGVARIFTAIFASLQLINRRPLLISSAIGMTVCMFTSAILIKVYSPCTTAAVFVLLHVCFSTYGVLVIPASLIGELLSHKYRGKYSGYIFAYVYFIIFVTVKFFIQIEDSVGTPNVFIWLGTFSIAIGVFTYFTIPETRMVPLEVIQEQLNKNPGLLL